MFRHFILFATFTLISLSALAQPPRGGGKPGGGPGGPRQAMTGKVYGKVIDADTKKPVEYAVIRC
jgi:hypothetical protein